MMRRTTGIGWYSVMILNQPTCGREREKRERERKTEREAEQGVAVEFELSTN